ncbi:MAG: glycerol-3-phosphate dehydrogenase [Pyrinomonadaceae bacterium]|nr:glycerol-3-phosphate dehydrogenase [Pyrinomonadaceae bacterium]
MAGPQLPESLFDVIVIGAGINGAGIARDAALRGLKVLLLDKGDLAGGTSSWSTRLIHGGLRYLEHGDLGLVRESLRERDCLLRVAPHLVRPVPMLLPVYRQARRGLWTIRAGMIAYDVLSAGKSLPRHQMLSTTATLQQVPSLNPEDLEGSALYFDAQVEFAERLVVENVLSAVAHGATVVTYARVDKLSIANNRVTAVEYSYGPQGTAGNREHHSAHAPVVVNAAGPWIDEVLSNTSIPAPRLIGGTKGSHLIVSRFAGAPDIAIYVEAASDQRPFFIIPWNGNYLIGTTDIRYQGDLDDVRIGPAEVAYLLRETNRVIPAAQLTSRQILYTYAGVRPLPFVSDTDEPSITRRHFIRELPGIENLLSIVGGKLTTYRSLAAATVAQIFQKLRRQAPPCTTHRLPLPGAAAANFAAFCQEFKQRSGLRQATADRWLRIYGTRASLLRELMMADRSLAEVCDEETGALAAEVVFAFKHELAQTLVDCLFRRTMIGLNSDLGLKACEVAARVTRRHLGWSESRVAQQLAAYHDSVARLGGVKRV